MRYHYNRKIYSKEQYERWNNNVKKVSEYARKHTSEEVKKYKVDGFFIKCIQRKYDACMKKENQYGVQVFNDNPETCGVENIMDICIANEWFNNVADANNYFKEVREMLR